MKVTQLPLTKSESMNCEQLWIILGGGGGDTIWLHSIIGSRVFKRIIYVVCHNIFRSSFNNEKNSAGIISSLIEWIFLVFEKMLSYPANNIDVRIRFMAGILFKGIFCWQEIDLCPIRITSLFYMKDSLLEGCSYSFSRVLRNNKIYLYPMND